MRRAACLAAIALACAAPVAAQTCPANPVYAGPAMHAPIAPDLLPTASLDLDKPAPPEAAAKLRETFDRGLAAISTQLATQKGVHASELAMSVEVIDAKRGRWSASSGVEANAPPVFWIASIGKMITAAVILQMVEESRLSLEASIAAWLPDLPNAKQITVDQLLHQTAGVFSFNADRRFQADPARYRSPGDLIAIARSHGADFCPGTAWNYSNTGYVALAAIAERIDGKPFADIVQTRIAEPLGLATLRVVRQNETAGQFIRAATDARPAPAEIASISGAGAITSDAHDLAVFLNAFLTGRIIPAARVADAFQDLYPMYADPSAYGRGVMVSDVPDPQRPTVWLGHAGGSPDAKALAIYDVKRQAYVVVLINVQAPAEAMANALLKALDAAPN